MPTFNDPRKIAISIGGVPIRGGYADGEFCRIEKVNPDKTSQAGASGEVVVSESNDNRWTITLIFLQTAAANALLSSLRKKLRATNGTIPIQVADLQNASLYSGDAGYIMTPANVAFGKDATPREWQLEVDDLDYFTGGTAGAL